MALGSNLIIFPELGLSSYECGDECSLDKKPCTRNRELPDIIHRPETNEISELDRKHGAYVILGMPDQDKPDKGAHSTLVHR